MKRHRAPRLYTVDLHECETLAALAPEAIGAAFVAALQGAGASIVEVASHVFPGAGLTCVLILRESHAVLHTWPETGTVNIDIFSCSERLRCQEAIDGLGRSFGARRVSIQEIARADGHAAQPDPRR